MEKIILPKGFEIDLEKSSNTEIVLKKREENKLYRLSDIISQSDIAFLDSKKQRQRLTAISHLHILAEYYNRVHANGWVPDFKDNLPKWYVSWDVENDRLHLHDSYSIKSCNPVWASEALIKRAYACNRDIFHKALMT